MAAVNVKNINGETISQTELPDHIYKVDVNKSVLNEVVTMQMAAKRSGTASAKTRSFVTGSTGKLFRQKGTGRARRGDIKSPLLKGGGVVFGPNPRSYDKKVPKKIKKLALKMALSSKVQDEALTVMDAFVLDQIKTKEFVEVIDALGVKNVLIVTDAENQELEKSARNVPDVKVLRWEGLNVYDILKYRHVVLLQAALAPIEGRLN